MVNKEQTVNESGQRAGPPDDQPAYKAAKPGSRKAAILDTAQALFNANGVFNVTTNHIAAEMGISPGNLYYHFRNREDIIWHLFNDLQQKLDPVLTLPDDETIDATRMARDITMVISLLLEYRFFLSDTMGLIYRDDRLAKSFRSLQARTIERIAKAYSQSYAIGPKLKEASPAFRQSLARNSWLIILNWVSYLQTARRQSRDIRPEDLAEGVFHVFVMMQPYLNDDAVADVEKLIEAGFGQGLDETD